jgi:predicted RNA-binding protein with RPS1 domain
MNIGSNVNGLDFKGNNVSGRVEYIVGFGDVAVVRINDDRTGLVECYVNNLNEQK